MDSSRRQTKRRARHRADLISDIDELKSLKAEPIPSPRDGPSRDDVKSRVATWDAEEELALLENFTCSVTARLDLRALFRTILEEAIAAMGADRGIVFWGRQDTGGLVPIFAMNMSGQDLGAADRVSRTILARGRDEIVITHDASLDPRFSQAESVRVGKLKSVICGPMSVQSGQIGALYLDADRPNAFPDGVARLFGALSRVAAASLENARIHGELVRENDQLRMVDTFRRSVDRLIGTSPASENLRCEAMTAAWTDEPIVITGEPGSGRSLLARIIHQSGRRAREPFAACDCSGPSDAQQRRILLGKRGAVVRRVWGGESGLLRQAHRGTLYIAGANDLSEELSKVLARLVSGGTVRPIGGYREERLDTRLILAVTPPSSGRDGTDRLAIALQKIHPLPIFVPPLRERSEDIPVLVADCLDTCSRTLPRKRDVSFSADAMLLLQQQSWPGNIRQLQQVICRLLLLSSKPVIDADDARTVLGATEPQERSSMGPWSGVVRSLEEWEQEALRQALLHTHGNGIEAARLLGIHRNTLRLKLRKFKMHAR